MLIKKLKGALAGVAQWIECWPANQRVTNSIPSQGTCLAFRAGPQLGVCERQPHIDVSLPPFPSLKMNKKFFLKKARRSRQFKKGQLAP